MPSIYKTPDGAVFKTPDGKLIKQPYDCGNAFQNRMGLNNYIEISGLAIEVGWSIIGICDTAGQLGDFGLLQLVPASMASADNIVVQSGRSLVSLIDNIGYVAIATTDTKNKIFYLQLSNNSGCDAGASIAYLTNNINTATRTKLRLGASGYYTGNLVNPTQYLHSAMKINKVIILDRSLSLVEYQYFRNNMLFNDLQSSIGVRHVYHLGTAEVINMAGTDTCCLRDTVGSVHANIINLPAGTAQQKVNYYNTNLSVPFKS